MAAPEFLWLVVESALGTPKTTPVAGTDSIYIRLADGNSFTMEADPITADVPYGGGLAITAETVSDHTEVKGSLATKLYPAQASLLLGWAMTRINSGQTAPWTTTELPGDLASVSCYHAYMRSDGTYKRTQYAGTKVLSLSLSASRQDPIWKVALELQAVKNIGNGYDSSPDPDATAFPAPAETAYPTGPYMFGHTAGLLNLGGSVRTQYDSLALNIQNAMDPKWYESHFLSELGFHGRASTLEASLRLKATPDDRTAYEALTAQACSLALNNGTNTLTIQYNGQNTISKLPRDLPLNTEFMRTLSLKNRFDPTAAADISFTYA